MKNNDVTYNLTGTVTNAAHGHRGISILSHNNDYPVA